MKIRELLTLLFMLLVGSMFAQQHPDKLAYIEKYKDLAIQEMYKYKIPASITLAQGILESGSGKSLLASKANNHFGIKCHKGWDGPSFHQDDDAINECFRSYSDPVKSFEDHSIFLSSRSRYSSLFQLKITDYKGWARGLKKAGYATDPNYPHRLIKIIKDYELYRFDKLSNKSNYQKPKHSTTKRSVKRRTRRHNKGKDFEDISLDSENVRNVDYINNVKFVYAQEGDSYASIAKEFNVYPYQLARYNEADKSKKLSKGEIVFLQRKKNKAKNRYHKSTGEQSLYDIAQLYGVKISKLMKYNEVKRNVIIPKGEKIYLRKKKR